MEQWSGMSAVVKGVIIIQFLGRSYKNVHNNDIMLA
jgi:hypothetical protein